MEEGYQDQPFENVAEGMEVYDVEGEKVGEVKTIFFGDVSDTAIELGGDIADSPALDLGGDTFVDNLADVFGDDIPRELAERLINEGYLLVEGGLLRSDRFVLPYQVAQVSGDEVHLNVDEDELIKR